MSYSFKNHFLIAMPSLSDDEFKQSVTFICEHSDKGSMGLVINQPIDFTMEDLFDHLNLPLGDSVDLSQPLYSGGPVQKERGFILHNNEGDWESTLVLTDDIALTVSKDILEAIALGAGPRHFLITLGYAAWDAGQLEKEIVENSWLSVEADPDLIFLTQWRQRWQFAAKPLGVDLNLISHEAGHS